MSSIPIRVVTISRQAGAGGGELSRRLAALLNWKVLDRDLFHRAAAFDKSLPDSVEQLDEPALPLSERLQPHSPHEQYRHALWEVARHEADNGSVIFVGRGMRHFLGYAPDFLHLRLVAPVDWRARRYAERFQVELEVDEAYVALLDRARGQFLTHSFGTEADAPTQYDLVANTSRIPIKVLAEGVSARIEDQLTAFPCKSANRILTLSRQRGAGARHVAAELAEQWQLDIHGHDIVDQAAQRLGTTVEELSTLDEKNAGLLDRWRSGSLFHPNHDKSARIICDMADAGNALVGGRGANQILADHPNAFHLRLVAFRVWRLLSLLPDTNMDAAKADHQLTESDLERGHFHQDCFERDWADPLWYHVVVNAGRLLERTSSVISDLAIRHWSRVR